MKRDEGCPDVGTADAACIVGQFLETDGTLNEARMLEACRRVLLLYSGDPARDARRREMLRTLDAYRSPEDWPIVLGLVGKLPPATIARAAAAKGRFTRAAILSVQVRAFGDRDEGAAADAFERAAKAPKRGKRLRGEPKKKRPNRRVSP